MSNAEKLNAVFCVVLLVLIKATHAVALFQAYDQRAAVILTALAAGGMAAAAALAVRVRGFRAWPSPWAHLKGKDLGVWSPVLVTVVLFVLLAAAAAAAPPRHADSLRYHLLYGRQMLETGTTPFVPDLHLAIAGDAEVLFGAVAASSGDRAIKPLLLATALLAVTALAGLLTRVIADRRVAIGAALLIGASPMLLAATTIEKPDVLQLAFLVLAFGALERFAVTRRWGWLVMLAAAIGEVVALKWTGFLPAGALIVTLAVFSRHLSWKPFAAAATGCALMPLAWYVRNWAAAGNPIWPLLEGVLNRQGTGAVHELALQGLSVNPPFEPGIVPVPLRRLYFVLFDYAPGLFGGYGPLMLAGFAGGLLLTPRKWRLPAAVFLLSYIAIWMQVDTSFRHLLLAAPAVALIAAFGIQKASAAPSPVSRAAVLGLVLAGMLFQLAFGAAYSRLYVEFVLGRKSHEAYLATTPNHALFTKVNETVGDRRVLAALNGSETYYLRPPHMNAEPGNSAPFDYQRIGGDEFLSWLEAQRFAYILVDDRIERAWRTNADLARALDGLSLVYRTTESTIKNRLLNEFEEQSVRLYQTERSR